MPLAPGQPTLTSSRLNQLRLDAGRLNALLAPSALDLDATQLALELAAQQPSSLAATQEALELAWRQPSALQSTQLLIEIIRRVAVAPSSYRQTERIIRRLRRAPHLAQENRRVAYRTFKLDLQRGIGVVEGQGQQPLVMLRCSRDGGHTWGEPVELPAGPLGASTTRAIARRLGHARDMVFEVTVSDPVAWSLVQAWLELEPEA